MTVNPTQVFQMRLDIKDGQSVGCILADESMASDETYSFFYAIPWRPDLRFENLDVILAGEKRGAFTEFPLHFDGQIFIQPEMELRFALHDPLSPQDFRGLPFLRSFPYIGGRQDVLSWYGITGFLAFLQLIPLDLIKMDDLFINEGIIFTGITAQFGRHSAAQNTGAESAGHKAVSPPLKKLFIGQLSDLYDAEQQWIAALPNIAKASVSPYLKNAFVEHLGECRAHVERLNQVFRNLGVAPHDKPCKAMTGLVIEGEDLIRAGSEPEIFDTGLVNSAQRIEHYGIGEYGTVRTMAEALGFHEAAANLEQSLREKEQSSRKFRSLADALLKNMVSTYPRQGDFETKQV